MELIGEVAFVIAVEEFWIVNKKDECGRRYAYLRGVINPRRPGLLACRTVQRQGFLQRLVQFRSRYAGVGLFVKF